MLVCLEGAQAHAGKIGVVVFFISSCFSSSFPCLSLHIDGWWAPAGLLRQSGALGIAWPALNAMQLKWELLGAAEAESHRKRLWCWLDV